MHSKGFSNQSLLVRSLLLLLLFALSPYLILHLLLHLVYLKILKHSYGFGWHPSLCKSLPPWGAKVACHHHHRYHHLALICCCELPLFHHNSFEVRWHGRSSIEIFLPDCNRTSDSNLAILPNCRFLQTPRSEVRKSRIKGPRSATARVRNSLRHQVSEHEQHWQSEQHS